MCIGFERRSVAFRRCGHERLLHLARAFRTAAIAWSTFRRTKIELVIQGRCSHGAGSNDGTPAQFLLVVGPAGWKWAAGMRVE